MNALEVNTAVLKSTLSKAVNSDAIRKAEISQIESRLNDSVKRMAAVVERATDGVITISGRHTIVSRSAAIYPFMFNFDIKHSVSKAFNFWEPSALLSTITSEAELGEKLSSIEQEFEKQISDVDSGLVNRIASLMGVATKGVDNVCASAQQ